MYRRYLFHPEGLRENTISDLIDSPKTEYIK